MRYLLLLLLWIPGSIFAQHNRELSSSAQVSLLTVAPGEELYSTFGHSAIRIFDPVLGLDRVYNYGTFDFNQPNFYVNFCRGKLLYCLDHESFRSFDTGNLAEQRPSKEQILALTPEERGRLYNMLENNYLPENRNYKYDFFYDNCATRIRDIISDAMYGQIVFDSTLEQSGTTMRQLLRPGMIEKPWTLFGMNLVLGVPTDKKATTDQFMFLPDYLHDAFFKAVRPDGRLVVIAERKIPTMMPWPVLKEPGGLLSPFVVMCIIAVLGFITLFWTRYAAWFDTIFWFVLGVAGLIIAFLWFFTDHAATKNNLNLFWALPTHLFVFYRWKRSGWIDIYFVVTGILAIMLFLLWTFLPQELPLPALPILLLIFVKSIWGRKNTQIKIGTN